MMTHDELVKIAVAWLSKPFRNAGDGGHSGCSVIISEMTTGNSETPDAIGFHGGAATLVECKASIADFKRDEKKYFRRVPDRGMGFYRYMMTPAGLLDGYSLPQGWGLIEVSTKGKTRVKVRSSRFTANHRAEKTILISLIRRMEIEHPDHVKVRVYTMKDEKTPRATAHINPENLVIEPYSVMCPDCGGIGSVSLVLCQRCVGKGSVFENMEVCCYCHSLPDECECFGEKKGPWPE